MCGIAGLFRFDGEGIPGDLCLRLSELLAHRGPDDEGFLLLNTGTGEHEIAGGPHTPSDVYSAALPFTPSKRLEILHTDGFDLALINRRLAILDLSPAGHLPMSTEDCSLWLAYNGQIYNFVELREELKKLGYRFLSNSDSEVILKAYQAWGVDCFRKFNGMWALALWDSRAKKLVLSRDHFGIKPLYYWNSGRFLAFSSEIKCLLELGIPREVNAALVYDYLVFGLLDHTDETFFEGIYKVPPAHFLEINRTGRLKIERFWDFEVSSELHSSSPKEEEEAAVASKDLFMDSVRLRLRSDVPVGFCLSGGLDSSSIVTVAHRLMFPQKRISVHERIKTFSSCFDDPRYDEREFIEVVLQETQAEANYVFPHPREFLRELDLLLWHQEEPFRSSSIYAQWCLMRRVRERGVTVVLDGQGGDEQLGGYRKFHIFYLVELFKRGQVRRLLLESLFFLGSREILRTLNLRHSLRYFELGRRVQGAPLILLPSFQRAFEDREWTLGYDGGLAPRVKADLMQFSLPALLRYEDKNSMAHSVEARLPFLDYRLVEAIAALPLDQKIRHGWSKYILRRSLQGILPEKICLRKSKLGFVTPEDEWFKQVLSDHVREVFESAELLPEYVNLEKLRERYAQYKTGRSLDTSEFFFRFFILELWGRSFILDLSSIGVQVQEERE